MRHPHSYYVYIVSNKYRSTFYIGITDDLLRRIDEHRRDASDGFTRRYHIKYLMYFEETNDVTVAIAREKQLKNWHRPWKLNLIRSMNPRMVDLAADWFTTGDAETSSA